MKKEDMTKEQLLKELTGMRQRIIELEEDKRAGRKEGEHDRKQFLNTMHNATRDAVFSIDSDGTILFLNKNFADRFGKSVDELMNKNVYSLLPPDLARSRKLLADKVFASGKPVIVEDERAGDYLDSSLYPIFDDQEKVEEIVIFVRDVTESKKAERDFRVKEWALESAINAIGIVDLNGKIVYVNDAAVKMWGLRNKDEIIGRPLLEFWEGEGIHQTIKALFESGGRVGEDIARRTDGSIFPVQFSASMIKDAAGKPIYMFGSFIDITERKKVEEALKESEENFRSLSENSSDYIMRYDNHNRHIYVNEACARVAGIPSTEFVGKTHREMGFDEEQSKIWEEKIQEVFKTGEIQEYEFEFEGAEGHVYLDWRVMPEISQSGKVESVLGVSRDITERKRIENALMESEERYRTLVDNDPYGVQEIDTLGTILYANKAHHDMYGYEEGELIGRSITDFLVPGMQRDELLGYLEILVKDQPPPAMYFQKIQTKHGLEKDIEVTWNYLRDLKGNVKGFISVLTDITERRQAEEELIIVKSAVEKAGEGIYLIDHNAKFLNANEAACRSIGYLKEELLSMTVADLDPNFPMEKWPDHWNELKEKGSLVFETIHRHKNGAEFPVEVRVNFLKFGDKEYNFAFARDITKRKTAEEELIKHREHLEEMVEERANDLRISNRYLEEAVKELETFSYAISHDLKAPLRAISGFSGMLSQDYSGSLDEEGNRILNVINENAVQMGQQIDDILGYSRAIRKPLEIVDINIKKFTEGVISELKGEYKDRDIAFNVQDMPNCKGDSVLMKQVLMNLISNAIEFTKNKDRAEIEIGSRQTENETTYFVKDNGVGFNMKYADKLFGLFQRLHGTKEFEGTGVGLALVQRLIHKHGGKIWAEAKVNEGATFYFSL